MLAVIAALGGDWFFATATTIVIAVNILHLRSY